MRDRPEFDTERPDDVELAADEQTEVDERLARFRQASADPELPHLDDRR